MVSLFSSGTFDESLYESPEKAAEARSGLRAQHWQDMKDIFCTPMGLCSVVTGILASPVLFVAWLVNGCKPMNFKG